MAFEHVINNNKNALLKWIDSGGDVNQLDDGGFSLLELSLFHDNWEIASLLVDRGANFDIQFNQHFLSIARGVHERSLLWYAASRGKLDLVKKLVV